MQCEEFEDRINAVLDQRERPEWDAELRLHCETCPECRALALAYGAALDGFYTLCATPAPADMAGRVLANLAISDVSVQSAELEQPVAAQPAPQLVAIARRPPSVAQAMLAAASLATAAGLLIAFLARSQPSAELAQKGPEAAQQQIAAELAQKSATPQPDAAPMPEPSTVAADGPAVGQPAVSDIAVEEPAAGPDSTGPDPAAGRAKSGKRRTPTIRLLLPKWLTAKRNPPVDPYAVAFKETGRGLAGLLLQVPGFGGRRGIIDAKENAESEPAWAVQVSQGLSPVTDSVAETFTILLESFRMTNPVKRS